MNSAEEKEDEKLTYEDILSEVGNFGTYQKRLMLGFMFPVCLFWPLFTMNHIYQLAVPDHWCFVPGREDTNASLDEWKNRSLPWNGWSYDRSLYAETVASEFHWVCDEEWRITLTFTLVATAAMLGSLVLSYLADRFGRRPIFYGSATLYLVFGTGFLYARDHRLFYVLIFLMSIAFPSCFQIAYIMCLEQAGPEHRMVVDFGMNIVYVLGVCLQVFLAWITRGHWVYFGLATTLPVAAFYGYFRVIPESARWLSSRGRYREAAEILRRLAKVNGRACPEDVEDRLRLVDRDQEPSYGFVSLFVPPRTRRRIVIIVYMWAVLDMTYGGLHININNLGGKDFLNYLIFGAVEVPAYLVAWVSGRWCGWRWSQATYFVLAGVSLLLVAAMPPGGYTGVVVLSLIGKFGISASYMIIYLQVSELFPTGMRSSAIGLASIAGNLAYIVVPYIVALGRYKQSVPYVVFGTAAVVASAVSMFLPESSREALPQTVADSEAFGIKQKFFAWNLAPWREQTVHAGEICTVKPV